MSPNKFSCPACGHTFEVPPKDPSGLTPKEKQVCRLLITGYSRNKNIAKVLGTTEQVIKNTLRNVYAKLGVDGRVNLALTLDTDLGRAALGAMENHARL